jgi:hypothetical protein
VERARSFTKISTKPADQSNMGNSTGRSRFSWRERRIKRHKISGRLHSEPRLLICPKKRRWSLNRSSSGRSWGRWKSKVRRRNRRRKSHKISGRINAEARNSKPRRWLLKCPKKRRRSMKCRKCWRSWGRWKSKVRRRTRRRNRHKMKGRITAEARRSKSRRWLLKCPKYRRRSKNRGSSGRSWGRWKSKFRRRTRRSRKSSRREIYKAGN